MSDIKQPETQVLPLSELKMADYNPRIMSKTAKSKLKASLEKFGLVQDIVWNKQTGNIVGGHQRYKILRSLGVEKVRVVVVDLNPSEEKQLNLVMNDPGSQGEFDEAKLEALSFEFEGDIDELDFGNLGLPDLFAGFNVELPNFSPEIDREEKDEQEDEAEGPVEMPAVPLTKKGELWLLGDHRVLCGDSTNLDDVNRLMDGKSADMCFTSPPYDQQRNYTTSVDVGDWDNLMRGVFQNLPMHDHGQIFVNLGLIHREGEWQDYWRKWVEWMRMQGWRRFAWYVWDQGAGLPGDWNGRLGPSFEFIFHFNKERRGPRKTKETKESSRKSRGNAKSTVGFRKEGGSQTVYSPDKLGQPFKIPDSVTRVKRNSSMGPYHPATFPTPLPAEYIDAYSEQYEIVFEPFLGSGSTLIAAQGLDRICYGMEIEPLYLDVVLMRYSKLTGNDPEREDGLKWSELKEKDEEKKGGTEEIDWSI